jgi:hypothetical protein
LKIKVTISDISRAHVKLRKMRSITEAGLGSCLGSLTIRAAGTVDSPGSELVDKLAAGTAGKFAARIDGQPAAETVCKVSSGVAGWAALVPPVEGENL